MMTNVKPLIKICGITSLKQALQIAELNVDAIGVISVNDSPRYIENSIRCSIFKSLEELYPNIKRVLVVKNLTIDCIKEKLNHNKNFVIQLHGDETPNYCKELKKKIPQIEVWKAFRIKNRKDIKGIAEYENFIDAILLDSWSKDTYGGSGKKINKENLKNISFEKPWWLAGGISIDCVNETLKAVNPYGIDISSGVEIIPGVKNIEKVREIVKEVRGKRL